VISKACGGRGETFGEAESSKPQGNRRSRPQNEIAGFAHRNEAWAGFTACRFPAEAPGAHTGEEARKSCTRAST
jgi:hypothetical protein